MNLEALNKVADDMVQPGKGILAADESTGTMGKRMDAIGVDNTADNRRDYREMMFTAKDAIAYVSGVILYDETIWQTPPTARRLGDDARAPRFIETVFGVGYRFSAEFRHDA